MSRRDPLLRGQLVIYQGAEPAFSIEVHCRYPDLLISALRAFLKPGTIVSWQPAQPPRANIIPITPEPPANV